jgi:type I restriction enzyme, S subunit
MDLISKGSTINHLYERDFRNFSFFIPPQEEQITIAHFLDYKLHKIDRFIRKKKKLIGLLNEQKAAIINDAVTKGLDPSVKMKDSGIEWLGVVPEHWEVIRTKHIFQLVTEFAPPNNSEVLLSIYTQYGVKPRTEFEERGNRATTTDNYWIVKKQDIIVNKLLAWMGAIGISEYDGVTSPAYDILRSKGKADPYFYHHLFRIPIMFNEFKRHSRGIMDVRLRLYFSEFGDIKLPLPPLSEQKAIVTHIEAETAILNRTIGTIEKEIGLVQEYRTTLIAEAVTGKIDVRSYELKMIHDELEEELAGEMGENTEGGEEEE